MVDDQFVRIYTIGNVPTSYLEHDTLARVLALHDEKRERRWFGMDSNPDALGPSHVIERTASKGYIVRIYGPDIERPSEGLEEVFRISVPRSRYKLRTKR